MRCPGSVPAELACTLPGRPAGRGPSLQWLLQQIQAELGPHHAKVAECRPTPVLKESQVLSSDKLAPPRWPPPGTWEHSTGSQARGSQAWATLHAQACVLRLPPGHIGSHSGAAGAGQRGAGQRGQGP